MAKACTRGAGWQVLTAFGTSGRIDAEFDFMASPCVLAEVRKEVDGQKAGAKGDMASIPGIDNNKALAYARSDAVALLYRWRKDPTDHQFIRLPVRAAKSWIVAFSNDRLMGRRLE